MAEEEIKVSVEAEAPDTSQEKIELPVKTEPASTEDQLAARIKDDFEKLYGSRLKQVEDRLHGAQRINERLQREVEQAKQPLPAVPQKPVSTTDPWANIQDGPTWKMEIERLAEQKARELLIQQDSLRQQQEVVSRHQQAQDSAKREVITKYPDLDPQAGNPDSPVSQAYVAVLNEHPDYLGNPYGPVLAMYEMEKKLIAQNQPLGVNQESARRSRASASATPASRTTVPGGKTITLTREQKLFCDRNNIKPEDYVRVAAAVEQGAVEA